MATNVRGPGGSARGQSTNVRNREILRVSDLNRRAKQLLETQFAQVWVEGELSNFARPASGHWYFTLKDKNAQVRCAMFSGRNRLTRVKPREGEQFVLRGRLSLYENRGDYQLIVEHMEAAGAGALQQALEELKQKLQTEGLFEQSQKQALPAEPSHIALVTSASGAVLRDLITVFKRRSPHILLSLFPVAVQGKQAAGEIAKALTDLNASDLEPPLDAIVVARGGGALEDLWAFNEEPVARAIAASRLPVVSAVGHETDVTISDLVADIRAPTPSAAAEILSPDTAAWAYQFAARAQRLMTLVSRELSGNRQAFAALSKRLKHPQRQLDEFAQHNDALSARLLGAWRQASSARALHLKQQTALLGALEPGGEIRNQSERTRQLGQTLVRGMQKTVSAKQAALKQQAGVLQAVSPLATLSRGYALVQLADGAVVRRSDQLHRGDGVAIRLGQGKASATIDTVEKRTNGKD